MHQCTCSFALSTILLVERVNLCKPCIICMLLCSWFQKGPYALDFWKIMPVIITSLFDKVVDLQRVTSLKKRLHCRCFPESFNKYLRKPFLQNTCFLLVLFLIYSGFRSSRWQMFFKMVVLKNFSIFTGKHLCWNLFLIKLQK